MKPYLWKLIPPLIFFCLLARQFAYTWQSACRVRRSRQQLQDLRLNSDQGATNHADGWHFNWTIDSYNHAFAEVYCDASFPDLYYEIDRAAIIWRRRGMTPDSISLTQEKHGAVRVLLHNQQIRILEAKGMEREDLHNRIEATLRQLQRALSSVSNAPSDASDYIPIPDSEFTIVVDDFVTLPPAPINNHTFWAFTRDLDDERQHNLWVIPDFAFWSSEATSLPFDAAQRAARRHDSLIADKIQQLVWRGLRQVGPELHSALMYAASGKPWANLLTISPDDGQADTGWWPLGAEDLSSKALSLRSNEAQQCDYAFICNTEGSNTWSTRLPFVLNCDSVPVSHTLRWATHYSHLLEPWRNFIPVARDFADLPAKIALFLHDPPAAQEIADGARVTFRERYTTPAATTCYWRRLLRTWASVAFKPEIYESSENETEEGAEKSLRGVPLAQFLARGDVLREDQSFWRR